MISSRCSPACIRAVACMWAASVAIAVPSVVAQEDTSRPATWYRSDADMIRRDPITVGGAPADGTAPPQDIGWALAVRREEVSRDRRVEVAQLYRDGTYQGYERTELTGRDQRPIQRERFDQDDDLLFREEFRYRQDGTLRETLRTDSDGETVLILYGMADDGWDEYVQAPGYTLLRRFDDRGRPAYTRREERAESFGEAPAPEGGSDSETDAEGGAGADTPGPVREEWFSYRSGRLIERRVHAGDRRELYRYRDGEIVFEEIRAGGRVVRTVERTFDEDGRPAEVIVREAGTVQREVWSYEPEGASEMERFVDGDRVFRERSTADGERTVTRYRDGETVVREFYVDDALYRRHIFVDGEIVRVEEL